MAIVTITTDTDGFTATSNDTYYLVRDGRLTSSGTAFSFGTADNANFVVEGTVLGEGFGIAVPVDATGVDIEILASGSVASTNNDAVLIAGSVEMHNGGEITSVGDDGIDANNAIGFRFVNDGLVSGVTSGLRLGDGASVWNNGVISAANTFAIDAGQANIVNTGTISGGVSFGDTLRNSGLIDGDVVGSTTNDLVRNRGEITGTISLGNGQDSLVAQSDDAVQASGGDGDDALTGGTGADVLAGDLGLDTLRGRSGDDGLSGGDSADQLIGGSGDDELLGGAGNDQMGGGTGDDFLNGGTENDALRGGQGDDELNGDLGNDALFGGAGSDLVDGRAGNDSLFGGAGADVFVFATNFDSDTISDFQDNIDTIDLTQFGFSSAQAALDFATQQGGSVVFDFGGGDILTVENVTRAQLANDLFT